MISQQTVYSMALLLVLGRASLWAQPAPAALSPVPAFPMPPGETLSIVRDTNPTKPFSVIGPRGALLGQQDGSFEGWIFPWKIFSNMRISARMQNYPVPIDVNDYAASIDVQPDHTTITFSHANFTIRETLLAPSQPGASTSVAAYFEIQSIRPVDLTFSFKPEMKLIWPAASDDVPSPEWVKTAGSSGFYLLHLNFPDHAAALALPGAEPGILAPYQERPTTYPLQFVLHFDPARDASRIYPLLVTTAESATETTKSNFASVLQAQDKAFASTFLDNRSAYRQFLATHTSLETPDASLDQAFRWAELSIDQLRVETVPSHAETALVAGFYTSGDSARPGFGWFFGRDALFTLYAVNSYGDLKLSRDEIEFLLKRQRPDGKIMHEWSQAAELVDWGRLPYEWAAADSVPLLLMEVQDYVNVSGDLAFVRQHWDQLAKAWAFETSHDSDGDGIYENTEGSGWVESWPPGMPHQEIYLAAVDQQASTAFAKLAAATGHAALATAAATRAAHIRSQIEKEYYLPSSQSYAFSRNPDGSTDNSATIFPSIAWWDGTLSLDKAGALLTRWASSEFSTDWGTRDLTPNSPFYDPISYHQGTVWPLYTGWTSLAEYRAGRPGAAYAHLKQTADLTWAQDLGAVTELLSGEFFHPLGRSTSHQLWSSAMVVIPTLRGLFGITWDAPHNTLLLSPNLPATWDKATVRRVPIGSGFTDLTFTRKPYELSISASNGVLLAAPGGVAKAASSILSVTLPPIEVFMESSLPTPGATTTQTKILNQQQEGRSLVLTLSGIAGSTQLLQVRSNDPHIKLKMDGNSMERGRAIQPVVVRFSSGSGYVTSVVHFTW